MRTTITQTIKSSLMLGYNLCFVGNPENSKKEDNFSIIHKVATASQVEEAFGSSSVIYKMYEAFRKVDDAGAVELDMIKIPNYTGGNATVRKITISNGPEILTFDNADILTNLKTNCIDTDTQDELENMKTNISTFFDNVQLNKDLLALADTHSGLVYTFNNVDLLNILLNNCLDTTSITQLRNMIIGVVALFTGTTTDITGTMSPMPAPTEDWLLNASINEQKIQCVISKDATINQIALELSNAINENANVGFTTTVNNGEITLTANTISTYFDTCGIELTLIDNYAYTTSLETPAVVDGALDDIGAFLNALREKKRLFIVEEGIDIKPLINVLNGYQKVNNRDLMGRLLTCEFDTYSNLLEKAKSINKKFVTLIGFKPGAVKYKDSDEYISKSCLTACFAAKLGLYYTSGADCSKVDDVHPIGNLNNQRFPIAGSSFDFLTVNKDNDWEEDAVIKNLKNNGVWTGSLNDADNLYIDEYTTTCWCNENGEPVATFRLAYADEASSSFISYMFNYLSIYGKHLTMEESDVVSMFDTCYKVCDGDMKDPLSGVQYNFIYKGGYAEFMKAVKETELITKITGTKSYSNLPHSVYSQLEEIIANVYAKFSNE